MSKKRTTLEEIKLFDEKTNRSMYKTLLQLVDLHARIGFSVHAKVKGICK